MSKSYEEMALEMTIAWISAVGQGCSTGKLSGDWLKIASVKGAYSQFFQNIIEETKNASKQSNQQ